MHGAARGARLHRPRPRCAAASRTRSSATRMLEQLGPAVNASKACSSTARPETARPSSPKAWDGRSAATCTCRTRSTSTARSSRCTTRSTTSRSRADDRIADRSSSQRAARPPLGSHPAAGRDGRRRADARHARPDVQPDLEVLRSAAPAEGERRRVPRGRLRPAAHAARRIC